MLKFSQANAKTRHLYTVESIREYLDGRKVYSLDLLSGHSCPYADKCLSKAVIVDGKRRIQDGPNTEFRCYSASQEVQYPNLHNLRDNNYSLLRQQVTAARMYGLIADSMPKNIGVCRIHTGGDFFNRRYFDAWLKVAKSRPDVLFYCYTKNIPAWLARRSLIDSLDNFVITASYGGRRDDLIAPNNLRYAKVILDESLADNLEIDDDDSHAADPSKKDQSFALLIHGTQPSDTPAAAAWQKIKRSKGGYSR